MNIESKLVIPPQVIARKIGEETVILDLQTGTYFGLDSVGARTWQLIESGKSLTQVCDTMIDEYEVNREVLEQDLLALASHLVEKKLLEVD